MYHFEEQTARGSPNAAQRFQAQAASPGPQSEGTHRAAVSHHSELLLDCAGFLTEKAGIRPADIGA
ncbi:MAG: hypothetical protein LBG22_07810, partial [Treponema sp.]|nr:hypothetical protein [Treponema sp.]